MINFDYITKGSIKEHNPNHTYRILITWASGSGITKVLLNLIKQEDDDVYSITGKIYLNVKDSNEAKYQYLFGKHGNIDLEHCKNPKAPTENANDMDDMKILKGTVQTKSPK